MRVKAWCSCIRNNSLQKRLGADTALLRVNESPQEGDLVVASVLTGHGAYTELEDLYGRLVRLYTGDIFVGVLGTRKSGRNVTGVIPKGTLVKGDTLHLIANGGLIAEVSFVPRYYGSTAMEVQVQGFLPRDGGGPSNLRDAQYLPDQQAGVTREGHVIFVTGTSSESGKTTFVCEALRAAKRLYPQLTSGAIKATGTGRLRDLLSYSDAGADFIADFVDAGWPSTYNIPTADYLNLLEGMLNHALQQVDVLFVEVGGDLLEAHAPEAAAEAARRHASVALVVNDAMGAMAGLKLIQDLGVEEPLVVSLKQNQKALAERLKLDCVIDPLNELQVEQAVRQFLASSVTERAARHA